jgi:hypothetical protein
MSRTGRYHPQLLFPDEARREQLPQPVREQCRQLLSLMLREVVVAEWQAKEDAEHE